MKRFLVVALNSLLLVIVACTSPVVPTAVPTVEPIIPPTLEQMPTATAEPTQRPTPTPPDLPVPYTTVKPTSVVTLTVTDITGTISTRGKAAVVWLADGVRHFGILDFEKASVSQLPFSLEDNYKQSGFVKWSPTGTAFIYEQHNVDYIGIQYDSDIFGVPIDTSHNGARLDENIHYFNGCTWSPDGQYVSCAFSASHASGGGWCAKIYDSSMWKATCAAGMVISCNIYHLDYCRALPLRSGKLWDPSMSNPDKMSPTLRPTEMIHGAIQVALTQFCWPSESMSPCLTSTSPNGRFLTYRFWPSHWSAPKVVILDKEQSQVWKVGDSTKFWSWSLDNRYFSWIEDDQVRLFDTINHTVTTYVISGAKMLNVTWSPVK